MPWTTAQNKLFQAAAHNPKIAKKKGIPMATAKRLVAEGVKSNKLAEMARKA